MKKQIQKIHQESHVKHEEMNAQAEQNRARSITVGTAFGGVTEIMMRRINGEVIWCVMQPVEVMELIHQLSANIGCHIKVVPRQDFSSWRDWRLTAEEIEYYRGLQMLPGTGWAPHVNDLAPFNQLGASLPTPQEQPGTILSNNASVGTEINQKIKKDFNKKIEKIKK